jgi:predicted acylesterase/phospholipase RssA
MTKSTALKRSLVLAGGGVRLAYHAGVLVALQEEGLEFQHVDGTSGGIFGTAMLASGISPREAAERWRSLDLKGFITALPLRNYRSRHSLTAIGSATGVRSRIFPALGIDVKKINTNKLFDATFNVCNFSTKSVEAIPHQVVTEDHLIAGISLPVFMPAVNISGTWYTDAVWIKDANITEAVNRGSTEIWLVWCIGNTPEYLNGFLNQYVHMIEMSATGGLVQELAWLAEYNAQCLQQQRTPVKVHLVKPQYPLPLDPDFLLGKINADTLVNMGYADTKKYLASRMPLELPLCSQSLVMKSARTTLHFRQQFEGSIHVGDEKIFVVVRLAYFVHETVDGYEWRQYSSVETSYRNVSSGYGHVVRVGSGLINSRFDVKLPDGVYSVTLEMRISGVMNFLVGLEIKQATVSFQKPGGDIVNAVFYQSGLARLRNLLHMNIKAEQGWYGKFQSKRRILKTVFT